MMIIIGWKLGGKTVKYILYSVRCRIHVFTNSVRWLVSKLVVFNETCQHYKCRGILIQSVLKNYFKGFQVSYLPLRSHHISSFIVPVWYCFPLYLSDKPWEQLVTCLHRLLRAQCCQTGSRGKRTGFTAKLSFCVTKMLHILWIKRSKKKSILKVSLPVTPVTLAGCFHQEEK